MPFKSEKQRRYLYKFHPKIAKEWQAKYGGPPQHIREAAKRRRTKRKV